MAPLGWFGLAPRSAGRWRAPSSGRRARPPSAGSSWRFCWGTTSTCASSSAPACRFLGRATTSSRTATWRPAPPG
eukprot:5337113-Alexandrium_andersonii.AAC.1